MNISRFFRSTPVETVPSYTSSQVSHFAKKFINELEGVKNTADRKGNKVSNMYKKTVNYAGKLAKSAEKGKIKDTKKYLDKLTKHSDDLFSKTNNVFTESTITAAKVERSNIEKALWGNKLTLR